MTDEIEKEIVEKINEAENIVNREINKLIDHNMIISKEYTKLARTMGVLGIAKNDIEMINK